MSLDIILTRECGPRETFTDGDLISLSHAIGFQEELHQATADEPGAGGPPDDELELHDDDTVLTLGELRQRIRRAWPRLAECIGCPLNLMGRALGCHVRVDYPVDAATERAVARAATKVCAEDALAAESLLARTPVATPAFRDPGKGMFENAFAPFVQVPWEGTTKGVTLDAFWDLLMEPRRAEDGIAAARVLSTLAQEEAPDGEELPEAQQQLALMGYALRIFATTGGDTGYAVSG